MLGIQSPEEREGSQVQYTCSECPPFAPDQVLPGLHLSAEEAVILLPYQLNSFGALLVSCVGPSGPVHRHDR